ncbi:hypothetical protein HDU83_006782 [Entophlyctis luteolus]|nr:hypothetical protein HDU83_006782 [Entophlyctis luteolus]
MEEGEKIAPADAQLYFPPPPKQQQQYQHPHALQLAPDAQPDYTAEWQRYFAENPGAYEAYMQTYMTQLQLQQQPVAAAAHHYAPIVPHEPAAAADYSSELAPAHQPSSSLGRVAAHPDSRATLPYYSAAAYPSAAASTLAVGSGDADSADAAVYEARIRAKIELEAAAASKHSQQLRQRSGDGAQAPPYL